MRVADKFTTAGVIGAGSFGLAMSTLLARNVHVLMHCRTSETANAINQDHRHKGVTLSERIRATTDYAEVAETCRSIFPAVPSDALRMTMREMSPSLRPSHYIIHCTKGFDVVGDLDNLASVGRQDVHTMSEVIAQETPVLRIGCLSGPNLAREILDGQPTATLIASEFTEVIDEGRRLLSSDKFFVFGSQDIIGAEIAGALKNVFALGSGFLAGKGLGKNIQSMLITRGLHEIVYFGKAMGAQTEAFLGTAGIGDLIATATSEDSRNYRCGKLLGQGLTLKRAVETLDEIAEGVRTLRIAEFLAEYYSVNAPITRTLYNIVYRGLKFEDALDYLMRYPYAQDVDFL